MNQSSRLGEVRFSAFPSLGARIKRAILPFIIGLALLVVAALGLIDPDFMGLRPDELYIPWIIFGAGAVLFVFGIFLGMRIRSIVVYENGITVGESIKQELYLYEDTSVVDFITKHSVNFIPSGKTHTVTLHQFKNIDDARSDTLDLSLIGVPQRKKAIAAFLDAHTTFWENKINEANVHELQMRFSVRGDLILKNGQFTYNKSRRKGDVVFSFDEITGLTAQHGTIRIAGAPNEKGREKTLATIPSSDVLNLPILVHVIQLSRKSST